MKSSKSKDSKSFNLKGKLQPVKEDSVAKRNGATFDKESEAVILEYKSHVEDLRKHNDTLKEELDAEARLGNLNNMSAASKIARLQEMGTVYAKKIEIETRRLKDLEREIEVAQANVQKRRAELLDVEGNVDSDSIGKTIRRLEHRLEKVLNENNEAMAKNRQYKEEINTLRRERVIFDKIYNQLEIELKAKETELKSVIEQSEKVKQERIKAQDQIDSLKQVVTNEQKKIEEEYRNFFGSLEHESFDAKRRVDTKIHEDTSKIRLTDESKILTMGKGTNNTGHTLPMTLIGQGHESPQDAVSPAHGAKTFGKMRTVKDETAKVEKYKQDVDEYEKIFEMLRARTGMKDIDQIIELFQKYEEENQSLFQLANELSDDKEGLEKEINDLNKEIHFYKPDTQGAVGDPVRNKQLFELNRKIQEQEKRQEGSKQKLEDLHKTVDTIRFAIPIIIQKIGCQDNPEIKQIIEADDINEGNMLQCLGFIEKKADEILQMYELCHNKEDVVHQKKFLDGILKKTTPGFDESYVQPSMTMSASKTNINETNNPNHQYLLKEFTTALDQHLKDTNTRDTEKRIDFDEYRDAIQKEMKDFIKSKDTYTHSHPARDSKKIKKGK
jgi:chromosome segregation ATPase